MRLAWLAPLVAAVVGCKDNALPGCRIAHQFTLDPTPLTLTREATLVHAGTGFVLAALDADGVTMRWARLGTDGVLGKESSFKLPAPRAKQAEPWLAVAGKNMAGDQLVAMYIVAKPGGANAYEVQAVTQTAGAEAAAPKTVVDLPAGVSLDVLRLSASSTRSGQRAALAVGYTGQVVSPTVTLLKADAEPVGPPIAIYAKGEIPAWRCLTVSEGRGDLAVATVESGAAKDDKPNWRLFEMREDGGRTYEAVMNFDTTPDDCPTVTPTVHGYVLGLQNKNGTFFSEFDLDKTVVNSGIVVGALRFGGPQKQPRIAALAPMGGEYALLFDRPEGHEVWRFNSFGNPQGSPLLLASSGQIGPVSGVAGVDLVHATYLDAVGTGQTAQTDGNSSGNRRYLVAVDCPNAQPLQAYPDAGRDVGK
jgi:hypothetical protein